MERDYKTLTSFLQNLKSFLKRIAKEDKCDISLQNFIFNTIDTSNFTDARLMIRCIGIHSRELTEFVKNYLMDDVVTLMIISFRKALCFAYYQNKQLSFNFDEQNDDMLSTNNIIKVMIESLSKYSYLYCDIDNNSEKTYQHLMLEKYLYKKTSLDYFLLNPFSIFKCKDIIANDINILKKAENYYIQTVYKIIEKS